VFSCVNTGVLYSYEDSSFTLQVLIYAIHSITAVLTSYKMFKRLKRIMISRFDRTSRKNTLKNRNFIKITVISCWFQTFRILDLCSFDTDFDTQYIIVAFDEIFSCKLQAVLKFFLEYSPF